MIITFAIVSNEYDGALLFNGLLCFESCYNESRETFTSFRDY